MGSFCGLGRTIESVPLLEEEAEGTVVGVRVNGVVIPKPKPAPKPRVPVPAASLIGVSTYTSSGWKNVCRRFRLFLSIECHWLRLELRPQFVENAIECPFGWRQWHLNCAYFHNSFVVLQTMIDHAEYSSPPASAGAPVRLDSYKNTLLIASWTC